jgi:hypothetical protein
MSHRGVQAAPTPVRGFASAYDHRGPVRRIAAHAGAGRHAHVPAAEAGVRPWREGVAALLCRRDCGWYTGIAQHGYRADSSAMQPARRRSRSSGLPAADRYRAGLTCRSHGAAGVIVSNLAFSVRWCTRTATPCWYVVLLDLGSTAGFVAIALLKAAYLQAGSPVFDGGAPTVAA